jgi:hypothetical protein
VSAPCPKCKQTGAVPVGLTWWGGMLGPRLLNHVRCQGCNTTFNGKSGLSNQNRITIYVIVTGAIVLVLLSALVSNMKGR